MTIPVDVELMDGRWIAYVEGLPGCYASHTEREAALGQVPAALAGYKTWRARHGQVISEYDPSEPVEVREMIVGWRDPASQEEVNAFFAADVPPLVADEVETAARLLAWSHADLLRVATELSEESLKKEVDGEWNIAGILHHTARADRWYLSALGLAPDWSEAPQGNLTALLVWMNERVLAALPGLVGDAKLYHTGEELWSARKMVRRAVWHRRDHTGHVLQFREMLRV